MFKKITLQALQVLLTSTALAAEAPVGSALPPAFELTCRSKAKEVAAEAYRGCMAEGRKSQIDQIRTDYQQKLKNLREDYTNQLKKLSTGPSEEKPSPPPETSSAPAAPILPGKIKSKKLKPEAGKLVAKAAPKKRKISIRMDEESSQEHITLRPAAPAETEIETSESSPPQ